MDKDIDKLLSYSLDQLDEKEKADFENDLGSNPELEKELLDMQIILEAVALAEEPIKPSENLKESLIASLETATPFQGYVERFMKTFDLEKKNVEELFNKIIHSASEILEPCGIPKTSLYYFDGGPKVAHNTCGIVQVEAGGIFPSHQHRGKEWVLILQGSALDSSGRHYHPGDTIVSDENVCHSFRVGNDKDLIFAVILEKPNKWLIGRILMDYLFSAWRFKKQ